MEEKIIVYSLDDGSERVVVPAMDKRKVSSFTVTFAAPLIERDIERLRRGLADGLKDAAVTVGYAETEPQFLDAIRKATTPASATDYRVMTRAERDAEIAARRWKRQPAELAVMP